MRLTDHWARKTVSNTDNAAIPAGPRGSPTRQFNSVTMLRPLTKKETRLKSKPELKKVGSGQISSSSKRTSEASMALLAHLAPKTQVSGTKKLDQDSTVVPTLRPVSSSDFKGSQVKLSSV